MSKLLLDERPLVLIPSLATRYGLNEALILQQLHWALQRDNVLVQDDRRWVKVKMTWWTEQFPFWSESTIKRSLADLKDAGVIAVQRGREGNTYSIDYGQIDPPNSSTRPIETGQIDLSLVKREEGEREQREEQQGAEGALFTLEPQSRDTDAGTQDPDVEKMERIWEEFLTCFPGRYKTPTLTDPRRKVLKAGLKAIDGNLDLALQAVRGLKSYRTAHPEGSQNVDVSVVFKTNIHDTLSLTEKIERWARNAEGPGGGVSMLDTAGVPKLLQGRIRDSLETIRACLRQDKDPLIDPLGAAAVRMIESYGLKVELGQWDGRKLPISGRWHPEGQ